MMLDWEWSSAMQPPGTFVLYIYFSAVLVSFWNRNFIICRWNALFAE